MNTKGDSFELMLKTTIAGLERLTKGRDRWQIMTPLEDKGVYVSTVELSMDDGFDGTPLWFETMVFPLDMMKDLDCDRYETKEQAIEGHKAMVRKWEGA